MALTLTPLTPGFVAEASGLDLARPLDAAAVRAIEKAMDDYAVLVFRDQPLDQDQQIRFAKSFGPLDLGLRKVKGGAHRFDHAELADISNVTVDGSVAGREHAKIVGNIANQLWHSDSSFQRPRAKYSMLSAVVVPQDGGQTEFADLRAAYDHLPEAMKAAIGDLQAVHYALHSRFLLGDTDYTEAQRNALPPVRWPLVQTDPRSGRKILFVGIHACEVVGMTVAEGRMLLLDLLEHATQREFVYRHAWRVGDLVMWDNTATLHRGRRFDFAQRRELRRATTEEVQLSAEARAAA
ncbi:TauD/TfdA family dioxygenase [Pigmentiphaga sp. GD03639]|jgi:alpha-ketoglutarate-dependent 2,4-dichlorophenoxyacetate dioxygenase|uniref:2-(4-hydroxyphenoxy)-propionic acid dioxygenase n=2 Tax=Pigmentiphaga TaxID=152267 RepID=A0A1P8DD94_9BURK|nr:MULTISPECIES: TauD/TfdA family dioxygenase [unclassified Pigmentiphaga]APU57730.1 2-(4-hydroxyphenoxy)-propionic acid dioxygenase [Pigmentiphaga sp. DL-8]MDH2238280.1 TauD/TfdA family dioxygenase [Pigmentiphaga sp. GD03639]OVZ66184.1 2,4-dichlorophenoxyacetate dioxygenase [Pigmentiphaga sp. NML030171]